MVLVCLFGWVVGAGAQELGTAVLNGDVSDPQGAVVSGAQVSARNAATGEERTTETSKAGLFVINSLQPGAYEIEVAANGFAPVQAIVRLQVGQQANRPFRLSVKKA